MDPLFEDFSKSIGYDHKLAEFDVKGSIIHVGILRKAGYLKPKEASQLVKGLNSILVSIRKGAFKPDCLVEDIHTQIQNMLEKKAGPVALKLHTARSRNDQVAFASKLYCKDAIAKVCMALDKLSAALLSAGKKNKDVVLPGYTHMQHAQPVSSAAYFGAYAKMFTKDAVKLLFVSDSIELTMGAGALAGTPIASAKYGALATENAMYAVSDRDFVVDTLAAIASIGMHISRLSEDLLIWSTKEFDLVDIDEAFCTGSSLMPQKKNADSLELIRGSAGRLYGNLISVMVTMKALPMSYNRDMQLDKEPLFDSVETAMDIVNIMASVISTLKLKKDNISAQLEDESLYATDILYYLVKKGIAFKVAHEIVGQLVKHSLESGIEIKRMPEYILKKFSDKIKKSEIVKLFDPKVSVASKRSIKR